MATRRHNSRQAKSLRCYTLADVADLYGVHRNTVRHWQTKGLLPIDGGRPVMFHGAELNRFHKHQRDATGSKCGDAELYCLACRKPRRPALDMADYSPMNAKVGTLTAICEFGHLMTQRVNAVRLAGFSSEIEVTQRLAPEPIVKSA
jgi:Helix-turn-helix domain